MRRIVTFLIAVLIMMTVNAQTLTERQKGLAACACLMAQGDLERLEPAVKMALDNGVTINGHSFFFYRHFNKTESF